jgi:DNA-binding TFAR19-related protein (PDSD5 family)
MNDQDNNEQHELEKIRMKKRMELMEAQKRMQDSKKQSMTLWEKVDYLLQVVMMPDAYSYLNNLKSNEPQVYQRIINELITPDVIQSIDYLMALIAQRGGVARRIEKEVIIFLERKIKGIKSKIQIKQRDGEMMDLSSYLSK